MNEPIVITYVVATIASIKVKSKPNPSPRKYGILYNTNNAKIFIDIINEWGSFSNYIWHFTDNKIIVNKSDIIPVKTELSDTVSADLKRRGMKYVGSIIIYSYLQAIGIVNDHEKNCFLSSTT